MDDADRKDSREERVVNFALLIRQYLGPDGRRYQTIVNDKLFYTTSCHLLISQ